jgi:hypothetical protein
MITLKSLAGGVNDGVRHSTRPPPYPTVVAVKLSTISEDACAGVHHRASEMRAFAYWQLLQWHVPPQLQTSPHWHEAVGTGAGCWQPQVH